MNATDQAKNSFKTFLITLVVSLALFGAVYFVASNYGQTVDIESSSFDAKQYSRTLTEEQTSPQVAGVFGQLAQQDVQQDTTQPKSAVLGVADVPETTQSTVPSTGISGTTYAFILSLSLLMLGFYLLIWTPRKRALAIFENKVRKQL